MSDTPAETDAAPTDPARALPPAATAPAAVPARATGSYRPLPERRFSGPLPWLVGIMMFLMVLAAALGLGFARAARALDASLDGRVTVQVIEADPVAREIQADRAVGEIRRLAGVVRVTRVEDAAIGRLLTPWFGADGLAAADLPLPALIDVDLTPGQGWRAEAVAQAVRRVAPAARIDDHSAALAPLTALVRLLGSLSAAIVVLTTVATGFVVVLATRAALDTHAPTIEVLHLLGATDRQVARLFQRRITRDALMGAAGGALLALAIILIVGVRAARLGSELASGVGLGPAGWLLLLVMPLAAGAIADIATGWTVGRALRRAP